MLTEALGTAADNLFGVTPDEVQRVTAGFDTPKRFAALARQLFARFAAKHLAFYLEREVGRHLGDGQRFPNLAALTAFRQSLADHCQASAVVVEEIAADWYSKKRFETNGNIPKESADWLTKHALDKLTTVLKREVAA